ncbi:MAG: hypothetical protein ACOC3Z_03305 [Nanoarchaeota archaeon]
MKIYKIKNKVNEHGFYTISKKCINGEFYRFNDMLKTDERKLIKSAICNWFEDKYGIYVVCLNGYDSISLQSDKTNEIEDFYFNEYIIYKNDYLVKFDDWLDFKNNEHVIERYVKLDKLKNILHG